MLTLVCGSFHPHLERALVDDLIAAKDRDALEPQLVVVPSESLRRRVAWVLARERRRTVLNLSVFTFHQLSRHLVEEATGRRALTLTDDHAYEELTRLLIERAPAGAFDRVAATRGGCAALWQTLRDLKDGRVSPEAFVQAVAEGVFPAESGPRLATLAALYRDVLETSRSAGWRDYTDLDAAAAASTSSYLRTQRTIAYYGFYDLTQAQYDVVRGVAARTETVVYFPMVSGDPSWTFAERFFQRYLVGLTSRPPRVLERTVKSASARVVTCSGANDEVVTCAKEILRSAEEDGVAFEDIGVVARSLEPYLDIIAREFGRHGIPFVTAAQRGLSRHPLAQATLRLLRIAEGDPSRDDVMDLLSSPWCRIENLVAGADKDVALWNELAKSIGVSRGYAPWERLAVLSGPEGDRAGATRGAQAARLLAAVHALRDACAALPSEGSAARHVEAWRVALASVLGIARDPADDGDGDEKGQETAAARAVMAAFEHAVCLDGIRPVMSRQAYIESVRRRIEATVLPVGDRRGRGVLVADATAGRGVGFRVLLVLGLNDGVFPRVVREDAFLRDHDRRLIETTLGYKLPEKLAGYDEERLLFSALLDAGQERLVLLTQRADEAGRPLAPSWYLEAWRRQGARHVEVVDVPRRTRDKPRVPPFDRLERYTPNEVALLAALRGDRLAQFADDRVTALVARAERLRRSIDAWDGKLSPFDGDVGPPKEWLAEALTRGYTASGLKRYAECPWRFFVTEVLGLEPPTDAEESVGPTVREWGMLAHEALARAARVPDEPIPTIWGETCATYARRRATGYPLMWEVTVEGLGRVLAEVAADDREDCARTTYVPTEFEVSLSGVLPAGGGVPIHGRLDRIDTGPGGRLRVIDWKFQWKRSRRREDLVVAALRAQSLQPPLYAALARAYACARDHTEGRPVEVAVYTVRPRAGNGQVERARYEPDSDSAERIGTTIATLVDGIESGVFPMIPDVYCARCDVAAACRWRHAASRSRAERDRRTVRVEGVRRTPVRSTLQTP